MSYTKGERFSPFPGEKHMNQPKSKYVIQQILDLALPPPPKACVCMKTGTVSDPIMIPPLWHGTAGFETAGIKSRMLMISASTACGPIIFFPVPAVSAPEEINCGRSYFQEKASEGVTGVYVKKNRGSLNLTIKPAFDT